jgi:hypothetical protein
LINHEIHEPHEEKQEGDICGGEVSLSPADYQTGLIFVSFRVFRGSNFCIHFDRRVNSPLALAGFFN